MKLDALVIATQDIGEIVINAVGVLKSICQKDVQGQFVKKNKRLRVPPDSLCVIHVDKDREIIFNREGSRREEITFFSAVDE